VHHLSQADAGTDGAYADADADLYLPDAHADTLADVHLPDAHAEAVDSAGQPANLGAADPGPVDDYLSAANPDAERDGGSDQHVGSARRR
jgi:hypothetical protein